MSFVNLPNNDALKNMISNWGNKIKSSDLETQLLNFAKNINIGITIKEIKDIREILNEYPNVKTIIDSSGSHSIIRNQIMEFNADELLSKNDLSFIAEIKYVVKGENINQLIWTDYFSATMKGHHMVIEQIGETIADNTFITLRFIINKDEFNSLRKSGKAVFKKPLLFDFKQHDDIQTNLYDSIVNWINYRCNITNETVIGNIELTATNLPEYYSPKVYNILNGIEYYVIGDACFGVPFFTNINNGFKSGNVLSRILANIPMPQKIYCDLIKVHRGEIYSNYIWRLQTQEKLIAHVKNISVNSSVLTSQKAQKLYHSNESCNIV